MTPEERQVITGIFERLRAAENQPRDPEAERLIADLVARQPYTPYAMAQSIYVNEQAVVNLGRRIEELERALEEAKAQAARAQPQSGGFLSSLFGGGSRQEPPRAAEPAPGPSPWGTQPQRGYAPAPQAYPPGYAAAGPAPGPMGQAGPWGAAQPQGGGFLRSAVSTAAGVAGGVVLANMLTNAFSHHGGAGGGAGFGGFADPMDRGLGGQGFEAPGFGGDRSGGPFDRPDAIDHGNWGARGAEDAAFDRSAAGNHEDGATRGDGGADAAYDRSDPASHEDYANDHDPGNDQDFSGGDQDFSNDV